MTNISIHSQVCANGQTVEWKLKAGEEVIASIFTSTPMTKAAAFRKLIMHQADYGAR